MTNSLEYLRDQPAGDLAAFATSYVDAIAGQITALVDYLKTHGAEPHTGAEIAMRSHQQFLTETRQAPAAGGILSVDHWERRMSFIKNFPIS
jgi:RecA-family ATPase